LYKSELISVVSTVILGCKREIKASEPCPGLAMSRINTTNIVLVMKKLDAGTLIQLMLYFLLIG
jgi:hypothetical protein